MSKPPIGSNPIRETVVQLKAAEQKEKQAQKIFDTKDNEFLEILRSHAVIALLRYAAVPASERGLLRTSKGLRDAISFVEQLSNARTFEQGI